MVNMRKLAIALLFAGTAIGAAIWQTASIPDFGPADATRHDHAALPASGEPSFQRDVRPILEKRCVVCHGCYDAPCQLKLGTLAGLARGASKAPVYDGTRLRDAPLTRLGLDAQLPSQWRTLGFFPVLNEFTPSPASNLAASVLYRSLTLKREHPLPSVAVLPRPFDFSLDRAASCPRVDEYDDYARHHAHEGMPYGLPALSDDEFGLIKRWIAAGSPDDAPAPLPAEVAAQVRQWEAFLNGDTLKQQLMGRYLYEHLFLGNLLFEGDEQRHEFRLVRSSTPPNRPVQVLATRRPFDDPGVSRPYYRLVPELETPLAKTHMPFVLSAARMARWRQWFLEAPYAVTALPGYGSEQASNPFISFAAMPPQSRYRFMLDEAGYFVMSFIKGPVCRGQIALDVIDDHFWVFFADPDVMDGDAIADQLARQAESLRLPAAYSGAMQSGLAWREMARRELKLAHDKTKLLRQHAISTSPPGLSAIWNGEGRNANAALTVFRHFDSASVVQGLVGEPPKTAWVIGYTLFERIYYLLVAGFDPFGNVGQQLDSRLYMDFLRMEGETNFLRLLPRTARAPLWAHWYRDASVENQTFWQASQIGLAPDPGITFRDGDPRQTLYHLLSQRLSAVLSPRFDLASLPDGPLRTGLLRLTGVHGASLAWLPEVSILRVDDPPRAPRYFSLLKNTGHSNVDHLVREAAALLPAENTLTVVPGFIGAYPNTLLHTTRDGLDKLTAALATLASEDDYRHLADHFAIRRTDPGFWQASDAMTAAYREAVPLEAGLFDYSRLENR